MSEKLDLVGSRIGRFIVAEYIGTVGGRSDWRCICDCGKEFNRTSRRIKEIKSCGTCLKTPQSNILYNEYLYRATRSGISFALSNNEFLELISGHCYYCGAEPVESPRPRYHGFLANGIDRVDNSAGYVRDNSVTCCAMYNRSKSSHTSEEFLNWVRRVAHHQQLLLTR